MSGSDHAAPSRPEKSVEQLLTDFQTLNEQAMAIQAKLAMIALQLAGAGAKAQKQDQSMTDTVEF